MTEPNHLTARTVSDVLAFRDERGWRKFHNPKDLAISLSLEASELLECFQWSGSDTEVAEKRSAMSEELADVLIYGVLLADRLGLGLDEIVRAKLAKNAARYPADRCGETLERYDALKAAGRAERAAELTASDPAAGERPEG